MGNYIDYFVKIKIEYLTDCLLLLKNSLLFSYNQLINLTCVDNLNLEDFSRKGRFSLIYVLNNINKTSRLIVSTNFCDKKIIPSVTRIYKNGNWFEREIFDMFGIFFKDHLDMRRLLTDYGFKGFPLRKDFPLTGYLELRYSEDKRYVKYKKLILMQEYRFFDFESPWRQYERDSFVSTNLNKLDNFSSSLAEIDFKTINAKIDKTLWRRDKYHNSREKYTENNVKYLYNVEGNAIGIVIKPEDREYFNREIRKIVCKIIKKYETKRKTSRVVNHALLSNFAKLLILLQKI